jgi:hypothetical protein
MILAMELLYRTKIYEQIMYERPETIINIETTNHGIMKMKIQKIFGQIILQIHIETTDDDNLIRFTLDLMEQ